MAATCRLDFWYSTFCGRRITAIGTIIGLDVNPTIEYKTSLGPTGGNCNGSLTRINRTPVDTCQSSLYIRMMSIMVDSTEVQYDEIVPKDA